MFLRERDSHMAAALLDVAADASPHDSTAAGQCGANGEQQPPYFERLELPGGVPYLAFRPSPSPASSAALLMPQGSSRGSEEDEEEQDESAVLGGKAGGVGGGRTVVAVVGSEHVAGDH